MKILIIEDELAIAEVEKAYIEREGYEAEIAQDGLDGLAKFRADSFDLVLLDLMLPGMAGTDVCREIRRSSNAPILMVTAKSGEDDIVAGLDAGADDYIVKPFSPKILMARIRANLRKNGAVEGVAGSDVIAVGDSLVIDPQNFTVKKNGEEISLTRNEFMILSKMAARPEKTWSRDDLITYALGYEYDGFERSIDSYIKNIRKKLCDSEHENGYIRTVHGFGYKISE
ncbi:response regulator transcription factor [Cloacibacillus porcorum]|uniref:response regulator transcription factor n=1 Tax=Cloacibacillus porcorum TaxID=1197717 RepID=UPI0014594128|nr:response regulator transcription factor [Cloacibacillus porcorum]MCC8184748.1 response regulator transcription factor [Cloacibacillus porcorum]MDY5388934.1 response regulator transcription factor [Cloacibacillus porcorum]NMF18391.1 response regulator transcription factor [Cloacibacillus porcorum]